MKNLAGCCRFHIQVSTYSPCCLERQSTASNFTLQNHHLNIDHRYYGGAALLVVGDRCDTMKSHKIFDTYVRREVSWSSHNIMSQIHCCCRIKKYHRLFFVTADSGSSVYWRGCGREWCLQGLFQLFSCNLLKFLKMSIFQVFSTLPRFLTTLL